MKVIRGKIPGARKVVVYGPEGIGKSTFASRFPEPLFIDTEGSTKDMDVARTEPPSSWAMMLEQVRYVNTHPELCRTLIVDTADWAEMLCITHVCDKNHKSSIEEFGYGKGYIYIQEEFGRFLNLLSEVVDAGIHVVLTAHAKMRKFEQPDELGAYDRWEMKLSKGVAPMVKEWADMVLFCNYKTMVVNVDGQGTQKGKNKAQGGKRVMYTTHHSCWDAKNRYGLPDEVPFDYSSILHIIGGQHPGQAAKPDAVRNTAVNAIQGKMDLMPELPASKGEEKYETKTPAAEPMESKPEPMTSQKTTEPDVRIPKKLRDLMIAGGVDEWDLQNVVAARGYFPADMAVRDYPEDFVDGCLVGAWAKVYGMVQEMKKNDALVFN
ncbi:Uncharacterised protein [[Clostridium] symbiosum]|uniref:ATP-binding protein n=2 Tax=Clostridium symbiosum TaxID=1512 RepID=A0A6N3EMT7_CLOSY|nr:ATP-binding protein [[Clostridium] symbiosum]DAK51817.1 MAG TPA: AAA domain protein [Caudoviricetes sp.]ERI79443.1 hypothetical protein CLOSYM_00875 [[Clostridium] symbiosum ATCC 14940]MDM8134054.1 ATP-binding protein [[Clostridium] symbiosum]MDM8138370.1 ATP-binding protein [[Clostridium] symbiosum]MDM8318393.1 ATP-binding protein [[Clostridium] symbiosum]